MPVKVITKSYMSPSRYHFEQCHIVPPTRGSCYIRPKLDILPKARVGCDVDPANRPVNLTYHRGFLLSPTLTPPSLLCTLGDRVIREWSKFVYSACWETCHLQPGRLYFAARRQPRNCKRASPRCGGFSECEVLLEIHRPKVTMPTTNISKQILASFQ